MSRFFYSEDESHCLFWCVENYYSNDSTASVVLNVKNYFSSHPVKIAYRDDHIEIIHVSIGSFTRLIEITPFEYYDKIIVLVKPILLKINEKVNSGETFQLTEEEIQARRIFNEYIKLNQDKILDSIG
jgi:hypothetical protein